VRGDFARFDVVEIAVQVPGGVVAGSVKRAFRAAVYEDLIAKGYSPLALEYVDAARDGAARAGQTFVMRSAISEVRRGSDGGVVVTGWLGLVAPEGDDGEVSLFLAEVEELALPPETGASRTDGGPATGTRLAGALLGGFPAR
jgi:hypothetical protein